MNLQQTEQQHGSECMHDTSLNSDGIALLKKQKTNELHRTVRISKVILHQPLWCQLCNRQTLTPLLRMLHTTNKIDTINSIRANSILAKNMFFFFLLQYDIVNETTESWARKSYIFMCSLTNDASLKVILYTYSKSFYHPQGLQVQLLQVGFSKLF